MKCTLTVLTLVICVAADWPSSIVDIHPRSPTGTSKPRESSRASRPQILKQSSQSLPSSSGTTSNPSGSADEMAQFMSGLSLKNPDGRSPSPTRVSPQISPEIKRIPPRKDFRNWLKSTHETVNSFDILEPKNDPLVLQRADQTRAAAQRARKKADEKRGSRVGLNLELNAVQATDIHSKAEMDAAFAGASDPVGRFRSSLRNKTRAQAREAHRKALSSQMDAEAAMDKLSKFKKNDARRGSAETKAKAAKEKASAEAGEYYVYRDQHVIVKEEHAGGNSSGDDEWPLKDNPRKARLRMPKSSQA